ncbi:uncharacterized protein LOC124353031 [Homalodisca vitripennis]|uniref:uncharacterized protein LOC124353031 n=1 Tax=Homalodisca vitripennis TaxID=197043 RepID=UPI001EEA862F|nr:uncharacterized protein LOC124353031 [Homalodisca vitripennis]
MARASRSRMSGLLIAAFLACGLPFVYSASRGQRVRSSPDIPATQFTCAGRPPGYYADLETGCQVYHMCTEGGNQFSYRCPNTTLFQQRMLICAHWYQVNCSRSEQHYGANLLIGQRDKPFVNDDSVLSKEKKVKTLHNPEALQNLGPSPRENSARQVKSQTPNENRQVNRVFQNTFKREGESSIGNAGISISQANPRSTTVIPTSTRRPPEDLSSLPLAGSVLPGGLKSLKFSPSEQGFSFNSQKFQPTTPPSRSFRPNFASNSFPRQEPPKPVSFASPTPQSNIIERINLFATTKSPVSFTSKQFSDTSNAFQPSAFKKQPTRNSFKPEFEPSEPNLEFLPPSDQHQSDLVVASQENAFSSRQSTTQSPNLEFDGSLPETDVKAEIEQTSNGSLPEDRYNTFIKRFNPYEDAPKEIEENTDKNEEPEPQYHTFINRFVPSDGKIIPENNLGEQPEHVFVNRFVLTPEEQKRDKDRKQVDKLHNLLPPDDQLTVSFPNFDLMPPMDDSDDSESNKIELHLQDPRRTFFIPNEDGNDFSKADAAPIVVTIPLHSYQKSPPMWFRNEKSEDPCSRCHPSFIVNKETCMPCVIIR